MTNATTNSTSQPAPKSPPAGLATSAIARPAVKAPTPPAGVPAPPSARPAGKPPASSRPTVERQAFEVPALTFLRALIMSLGVAGGIGKSLVADTVAVVCRRASIPTQMIRLESGARRAEFAGDTFIDLDVVANGQQAMVGGVAAHFDRAWTQIEKTLEAGGVGVLDTGANSHDTVLRLAAETGLPQLVAAKGAKTIALVTVTRDADLIRQSAKLVADLSERMPGAEIVIVLNACAGPFVTDGTREGLAYRDELVPLLGRYAHLMMPLVGARALAAFASSRRSIPEIMEATDAELRQWSGLPLLAARSCQTHVGAFWLDFAPQVEKVLLCRAAD
jgi:hypothetical protein